MLELRPNCELCDRDLPPECEQARICAYECTYCAECVEGPLRNVCPTCGGGFEARPIRPRNEWRAGSRLGLAHHPAGSKRYHSRWTQADLLRLTHLLADIPVRDR